MWLPIIHPATFNFLDVINEKNSREFFATVKPLYQEVLESVEALCQYLIDQYEVKNQYWKILQAKSCMFRIYRDARRIKPWGPLYKHHFSFFIHPEWKKTMNAGWYVHIEPWNTFFASWIWWATAAFLYPLRKKFENYGNEYLKILSDNIFRTYFKRMYEQSLKRPPKWFTIESDHLELIKKKQHLIRKQYKDDEVFESWFATSLLKDIEVSRSWTDWLNDI